METERTDNWVVIYQAPDEATANIIAGLLQSEGIEALPVSSATTWGGQAAVIDSTTRFQEKYWGDVIVKVADVDRSVELMKAFGPDESEAKPEPYVANPIKSESLIRGLLAFFALLFGLTAVSSWTGHLHVLRYICIYGFVIGLSIGWTSSHPYTMKKHPPQYRPAVLETTHTLYALAFVFMLQYIGIHIYNIMKPLVIGIGVVGMLGLGYAATRRVKPCEPVE